MILSTGIQRVERQLDTDGDGRLERRENWTMGENETLTCTEIDADGDGKYEVQVGEGCSQRMIPSTPSSPTRPNHPLVYLGNS